MYCFSRNNWWLGAQKYLYVFKSLSSKIWLGIFFQSHPMDFGGISEVHSFVLLGILDNISSFDRIVSSLAWKVGNELKVKLGQDRWLGCGL